MRAAMYMGPPTKQAITAKISPKVDKKLRSDFTARGKTIKVAAGMATIAIADIRHKCISR